MGVIAFVPARGGSKSIPLKNIKSFCGKPLIFWNLKALVDSPLVDYIVVATDSDEIESIVTNFEFEKISIYRRQATNAQDNASTESVMLEFLDSSLEIANDELFLLSQLTNPFTSSEDITNGIQSLLKSGKNSLLSCARTKRFFWNKTGLPLNYNFTERPRRQDFEGLFIENGAFYINSVGNIRKFKNRLSGDIMVFEMPEFTQIEIDEPDDWIIAEELFRVKSSLLSQGPLYPQFKKVKLVLSDVDGVLTDAGMYYSENGDELKKFNTRDGKGFELLRDAGIKTGLITSENTTIVSRRAKKLQIDYLYQGETNLGKLGAIKQICDEIGCSIGEAAYIGDDLNCFEALCAVGFPACPQNAVSKIKSIPNIILLERLGGEGVFREFADLILSARS